MINNVIKTNKRHNFLYYLLILLFIIFPFGQLTRLPLSFSPSIRIYAHDIVIVLILGTWLVATFNKRMKMVYPPLFRPIGYFVAAMLISLSVNAFRYPFSELLVGLTYAVRWTTYASLYVILYNLVREDKKIINTLLTFLMGAGVVSALFGIMQYFLYPDLRNLMYLGWDPHEYRVFGTFFDSGFTGLIFVLTIIVLTGQWMSKKIAIRGNWIIMSGLVLTYIALALTYSRASFAALFIGFSVISFFRKSVWPIALVTFLLLATIFLLPQPSPMAEGTKLARTTSVQARLTNYEQSREIIQDHPVFGVGFNMLRYENRSRNFVPAYEWEESNAAAGLDNSVLFVWAATGTAGLIAYLNLIFQITKSAILQLSNPSMRQWGILILATLAAILTHSMFNNSLFYPWIMIWLWVLFGVAHVPRHL